MNRTWARPSWQDAARARAAGALWLWKVKFIVLNNKLPLNHSPLQQNIKQARAQTLSGDQKSFPQRKQNWDLH